MEAAEPRSRSRREFEDSLDTGAAGMEDDEDREDVERRSWSSMPRKHNYSDKVEEKDEGRRKSSGERNDLRRKSDRSSQAGSVDEDDYELRREYRVSKMSRISPEERGEKRSSDGYKDRDGDSSKKRMDEENEWDSSRRKGPQGSSFESSQSKTRSKAESSNEAEHGRAQDKDSRSSDRTDSSREKVQEGKPPRRRWDETYISKKTEETSKSSDHKHGSERDMALDYRNESGESSRMKVADLGGEKAGRSSSREERWEDGGRVKDHAKLQGHDEDSRVHNTGHEDGLNVVGYGKHGKVQERAAGFFDDLEQSDSKHSIKPSEEKSEEQRQQHDSLPESHEEAESRDWPTPERSGRHQRDTEEHDRVFSDSDNERSVSAKDKDRDGIHGDDGSSKGRDRDWNEKNREQEGSKDHWRRNQTTQDSNDGDEIDPVIEWRHGQERMDGGSFHSRPGYRKDSRVRTDSLKGSSAFGNRNESSDSIEIRPNKNLDFGREGSISVRRSDMGLQQDFPLGNNDDKWLNPAEDRGKSTYGFGDDAHERYQDDDQNPSRNSLDSQSGRARVPKGAMTSNYTGIPPFPNSSTSASFSRDLQQGMKGSRPSRGGRGRSNGRDALRIGVPMPMRGPPYGHLGLPPGPIQPIGPNMTHSPGPPLGPGVFIPPFPGPLVWPGVRGVDVNMLAVPPNLPPIPPVPAGPRFAANIGAGLNHPMHLNQSGSGRGTPANIAGPGFNPMGTPSREMSHDKTPTGWTSVRPSGKAPSRGEQNDYSQNFVDTGMRPQNFIRELELTSVVEDYPKLRELIQRKDEIVAKSSSPPMYYKCDLREHVLSHEFFGTKFDVILVDPPWEEYVHRAPGITDHIESWTVEEIMNLKIEAIADTPSFIFLWVGDGVGLEQGRQCLKKWGFRRCEDICWVKTNKKNAAPGLRHDSYTLFQHSKEHCLMGIKGTVRRSTDGHIIHANIDTDIIIAEEPSDGSTKKPEDMYRIIEHFALGRRRLELFGEDHNIRPGWLTVGKGLTSSNFNKEAYSKNFADKDGKAWQGGGGRNPPPDAPHLVLTTLEIEGLRPKSPPQKNQQQQSGPMLASGSTSGRRPSGSSDVVTPAHWSSSLTVGSGAQEGLGPESSTMFDSYGFNNTPSSRPTGDHVDAEPHRLTNLL